MTLLGWTLCALLGLVVARRPLAYAGHVLSGLIEVEERDATGAGRTVTIGSPTGLALLTTGVIGFGMLANWPVIASSQGGTGRSGAPPAADEAVAWWSDDWNYASTEALWAAYDSSAFAESVNDTFGIVSIEDTLSATPWGGSHSMRMTAPGNSQTGPSGIIIDFPDADTDRPREFWMEIYVRYCTSALDATECPNGFDTAVPGASGNPDHKTIFWKQPAPGRSQIKVGAGGANGDTDLTIQGCTESTGCPDQADPAPGSFWDGEWYKWRFHFDMGAVDTDDCIAQVTYDDIPWISHTSAACDDGSGEYFNAVEIGRTFNHANGLDYKLWWEVGPVTVYVSDPGWTFD